MWAAPGNATGISQRPWRLLRRGAVPLIATAALVAPAGVLAAGAPPPPAGWKSGWLAPQSAWIGRYHLVASRAVNPARRLSKFTGELTLFMQSEFAGKPPVPSGIISLHSAKSTVVLYLTELDHDGSTLLALVHGGAFVAPATGKFTLSTLKSGTIEATLVQKGLPTTMVTFKRFSRKPQP
jgi:hypothetical protein